MIERLKWDSQFFNLSVGKIEIDNYESISIEYLNEQMEAFDLIYIYSKKTIDYLPVEGMNFKLGYTDQKVLLSKQLEKDGHKQTTLTFNNSEHSYTGLLKLAYRSGLYSRFNKDLNFPNKSFHELYKRWIDKSIESKNTLVLVATVDDKISGFTTIEFKDYPYSQIGLIAVDKKYEGLGIASNLMKDSELISYNRGCKTLKVATQSINKRALNFYSKIGFKIIARTNIYHLWKR